MRELVALQAEGNALMARARQDPANLPVYLKRSKELVARVQELMKQKKQIEEAMKQQKQSIK
jgi:hypothetical protein